MESVFAANAAAADSLGLQSEVKIDNKMQSRMGRWRGSNRCRPIRDFVRFGVSVPQVETCG